MNSIRLAACTVLCALALAAGAQSTFVMHFDSVQSPWKGSASAIRETQTGYLITGWQDVTTPFFNHHFVRTIDHQGQVLSDREWWPSMPQRTYMGEYDNICAMDDSTFGGCISLIEPNAPYDGNLRFVRFDATGDTLYTKPILQSDPADSILFGIDQIRPLTNGGFAGAGVYSERGVVQTLAVRLDADGDTIWTRRIGSTNDRSYANTVSAYPDGGFVIGGYRSVGGNPIDLNNVVRVDSNGVVLWSRSFGERGVGRVVVRVAPDGHIYTWSRYKEAGWSPIFAAVLDLRKWTPSGTLVWSKRTQLVAQEMGTNDLEVLPDGGFIGVADHLGVAGLMRYDANGDSLWLRRLWAFDNPGGYLTSPYDVERTSDGGFIFCGWGEQGDTDPTPNMQTWFVIKTDSMGCVVPGCQFTGLSDHLFGLEKAITAYPNPSTGAFTLELDLPENAPISGDLLLQVFDMQGRQVLTRGLGRDRYQRISVDLTREPAGLYSAHLSDGRRILTGVRLVRE